MNIEYDFAVDMTGKNCLVTGATSGHGEEVALYLAKHGATVVIHGRNRDKLEKVGSRIFQETGTSPEIVVADFSSLKSVRKGAKEFLAKKMKLDLLVNNAGMVNQKLQFTEDGFEQVFQVNYLSMYLFTLSILPALKKKTPSRIVLVASDAHYLGKLDFDDLDMSKKFSFMGAYCHSKLKVVYFARELAKRLEGTNITVNAVDPGPIASGIAKKEKSLLARAADVMIQLTFPHALKAARSCLYLCMSPDVEGVTGKYFRFMKFKEPKVSQDPQVARELWERTAAITGVDVN